MGNSKEGIIGIPNENGGYTAVKYCAEVFDEDSIYGIDWGRISKLMLRQNGKIVYSYDRGLDISLQTTEAKTTPSILLKEYTTLRKKIFFVSRTKIIGNLTE